MVAGITCVSNFSAGIIQTRALSKMPLALDTGHYPSFRGHTPDVRGQLGLGRRNPKP